MGELKFFAPYKLVFWRVRHTSWRTSESVNVVAAAFVRIRKFLLKDAGRKLSHLAKAASCGPDRRRLFEEESD
jgi:hypothetical protein